MPPKRTNRWVTHVKHYKSDHPGMTYKQSLKSARPSYHSTQHGEGLWDDAKSFLKKHKVLSTVAKAFQPAVNNYSSLLGGLANRGVGYLEQNGYGAHHPSASHGRVKF